PLKWLANWISERGARMLPLRVPLQRMRREIRILGHQLGEHAVGPSESDLQRIFAAPAATPVRPLLDIVLLDQHSSGRVSQNIRADPAVRDFAGAVGLSVKIPPYDCQILQPRPAVRLIPLLAGRRRGRAESSGFEQFFA